MTTIKSINEKICKQAVITTIVLKILLIIILVIVILLHFSLTIYVRGGTGGELVIKAKYLGITLYPRPKKKKKRRRKKDAADEDVTDIPDEEDEAEEAADNGGADHEEVTAQAEVSVSEDKPETTLDVPDEETAQDKPGEVGENEKSEERPAKKKRRKKKEKEEKSPDDEGEKKESKLDGLKRKWEFVKPYLPPAWKYSKKLLKAIRLEDVKINIDTGKEDAAESAQFYGKLQAALFSVLNFLAMVFTLRVSEANVNCHFNVKRLDAEGEVTVRVRPSTVIAIAVCLLWCCGKIFIPYKLKQRRERKRKEKEARKKQQDISAAAAQTE